MADTFFISGLPQLRARLEAIRNVGDTEVMREIGQGVVSAAQGVVHVESGRLLGTIRVSRAQPKMVEVRAGGQGVDYAAPIEFGAAPHPIRARRRPLLVFFWKKEGRLFRGPKVNHPGNIAYPFFRPAVFGYGLALRLKAQVVAKWNSGA